MKCDSYTARLLTSATANNIENVRDVIENDSTLGVTAIAEMVNLDRESV